MPPQQPSFSCRAMIHSAHRRRAALRRPLGAAMVAVQPPVEPAEQRRPPGAGPWPVGASCPAGLAGRAGRPGQLAEPERKRPDRAQRPDDGQRHDRLPGPARPVVDVEREPGRQVDELRRHDRQVVPGPLAEHGQPDPGEDPGGGDTAAGPDPLRGPGHVRLVLQVPGQPQRDVGLDRGGMVARPAVEVGPGAVLTLLGRDPPRRRGGLPGRADLQEFAQQQILGVHGDVGLEFALPPALLVLEAEQVVAGAGQRLRRGGGRLFQRPRVCDRHPLLPHLATAPLTTGGR